MSGIYIHIPFCKQACTYCNFHFSTSLKLKPELLEAIKKELVIKKNYINEVVETIYFGGGTPSIIDIKDINEIIERIYKHYKLSEKIEITLEANPDDLKVSFLNELKKTGINRLSIGVQTFNDKALKFLNRSHLSTEAYSSIKNAKDTGFNNITIDLIYGIAGNSMKIWENDLEQLKQLEIDHFSAYALTIEPKTVLAHKLRQKPELLCSDDVYLKQFEMLMEFANHNQFEHYEISNFARNKQYAVHNTNYWKNKSYIGTGPSAHSYDQTERRWNISNNALYIKNINHDLPFDESETLSVSDRYNEYIMTSMRTMWGCDSKYVLQIFGKTYCDFFLKNVNKHIENSTVIKDGSSFILSRKGKFIADRICSDLFLV